MNYLKKLILSFSGLIYILISNILLIFTTFLFGLYDVFNLSYYIVKYVSWISVLINVCLIVYLVKRQKIKFQGKIKMSLVPYLYFSLAFTIFFNMLVLKSGKVLQNDFNIWLLIISSGLVGPFLEEIVFRKMLCDNLKKFNNMKKTIVISAFVFAICHFNLVKGIYALMVGLIYGYLYLKNSNIFYSLIAHVICNLVVLLIYSYDSCLFLLSIFSLLFSSFLIFWDIKRNKN